MQSHENEYGPTTHEMPLPLDHDLEYFDTMFWQNHLLRKIDAIRISV